MSGPGRPLLVTAGPVLPRRKGLSRVMATPRMPKTVAGRGGVSDEIRGDCGEQAWGGPQTAVHMDVGQEGKSERRCKFGSHQHINDN